MKCAIFVLLLFTSLIVLLVLLESGCRKEAPGLLGSFCTRFEEVEIQQEELQKEAHEQSLVVPAYKWAWKNNQQLGVFFYNGSPERKRKVIEVANEWARYCGMSFKDTVFAWEAHIRVKFDGKQYSSAVGTECLQKKYTAQPTMYLGDLHLMNDETAFRRIVLHEFGHALGLEHELKNPNITIPWDSAAVYRYYRERHGWRQEKVDQNIFNRLEADRYKKYDEFDSSSIMIYAIPDTLTKGRFRVSWPTDLSATDKVGIGKWYPKTNKTP